MGLIIPESHARAIGEARLEPIFLAIEEANKLLDFRDPEDETYVPVSGETLSRASKFLISYAAEMLNKYQVAIPAPRILPGPNGTIDLHWKTPQKELLINIPSNDEAVVSFYGDDYGQMCIKGTLPLSAPGYGIMLWLMNR